MVWIKGLVPSKDLAAAEVELWWSLPAELRPDCRIEVIAGNDQAEITAFLWDEQTGDERLAIWRYVDDHPHLTPPPLIRRMPACKSRAGSP